MAVFKFPLTRFVLPERSGHVVVCLNVKLHFEQRGTCVSAALRRGVNGVCALLGFYAAQKPKRAQISLWGLTGYVQGHVPMWGVCRIRMCENCCELPVVTAATQSLC
jgi:hypothetical protein